MIPLAISAITAGYGASEIVLDVDLQIGAGEVVCVLGRNGVGKSTMLKSILGLVRRIRGEVRVFGQLVNGWPTHRIVHLGIGYGPQELAIFQDLSVAENFSLGNSHRNGERDQMDQLMDGFPILRKRWNQRAGSLSGGEQKMLVFARALLGRNQLILLDEVVEGVQGSLVRRFQDIVSERNRASGTSFLIVEQNLSFALSVATRYLVMKAGRFVDEGVVGAATMASIEQHLVL